MTEISRIREYKHQHDELAKSLYSQLEKTMHQAKVKKGPVHRTMVRHLDNQPFICHIYANVLQAEVIIFKMIPTAKFFEAIAYDPNKKMYYLIRDHVFERYQERMHVKPENHLDLLYHYVRNNPLLEINYSKPRDLDGNGVTVWIDKGIIYGEK